MKYWQGGLGLLTIFASGALIGGVATRLYLVDYIQDTMADGPPAVQSIVVAKLSDRLDMSEEQEAEVRKIIEAGREELSAIHDEMMPRIESKVLEVAEQVKAVLDPDQDEELDAIVQEMLERWHEHQDNRPRVKL